MWKQSIFIKIYLSFWLATALIITTQISIDRLTGQWPPGDHRYHPVSDSLFLYGEAMLNSHLEQTAGSLKRMTDQIRHATGIRVFLLDSTLHVMGDRMLSPEIQKLGARVMQSRKKEEYHSPGMMTLALPISGNDGNLYVVVGEFPPHPHMPPPDGALHLTESLCIILLISGVVCYVLARYLTSPIIALREATRRVASGELAVRIAHTIGNRTDELSALASDFDHMTERIESLMNLQRQLLGDISHELRSPLARLNVALELVRRHTGIEAESALEKIEHETTLLNEMISQVLMLTRLESGFGCAQMKSVNLSRLLQEIAADGDFEARGNNRKVEFLENHLCMIQGNEELLRQAIENIVRNAIRYTLDTTCVEIRLEKIVKEAVPYAKISVRDYGTGVPDADLTHIFNPFFRVSSSRNRKTGGAGLGLSIAERAIDLHHGTLKAFNAVDGGGLIVVIYLPLGSEENPV
jgi:two-component system sensor histidine kinase CpxA